MTRSKFSTSLSATRSVGDPLDAGVVEGAIEASVDIDDALNERLDGGGVGDVAAHERGLAAGVLDHAGRLRAAVFEHVGDDHLGALAGEDARRGASDAGGAAGDERDLSFE